MAELNASESKISIFSLSAFLFFIPAYLYLCAFQYEKGGCDYYKIPKDLITPDLTTNLIYCLSFSGAIYFAYIAPHIISALFFYEKTRKNEAIFPFIRANCILILLGYFEYSAVTYPIDWLKTCAVMLIPIAFFNLMALMQYVYIKEKLKIKPYHEITTEWNNTVNAPETVLAMPDVLNLRWTVFKDIKMPQPIVLLIIVAIVWWSYNIGKHDAYLKTTYEVSVDKKGWILLKKYGDNLIMKNYDIKSKELVDSLLITKIGASNPLKFISKRSWCFACGWNG